MTDSSKKVEVRFGAFACTIEGYDDPVAQMREVLGMMQRMISETPALAEAAEFKPEDVEDALKDGDAPGVVVIRSAEGEEQGPDVAPPPGPSADDDVQDAASVDDTIVETVESVPVEIAAPVRAAAKADEEPDLAEAVSEPDDAAVAQAKEDIPVDRDGLLSGAATAAAAIGAGAFASKVFADADEADEGETALAAQSEAEVAASSTAAWLAERQKDMADTQSEPLATETEAAETQAAGLDEDSGQEDVVRDGSTLEDADIADDPDDTSFNIFAAPPTPDPAKPLIQTVRPSAHEAIVERPSLVGEDPAPVEAEEVVLEAASFREVDDDSAPADEVHDVGEAMLDHPQEDDLETNIFAAQDAAPALSADMEAEPEPFVQEAPIDETPEPVNIFASAEPAPTVPETIVPPMQDAPADETPEPVNIFASAEPAPTVPDPVTAAPEPEPDLADPAAVEERVESPMVEASPRPADPVEEDPAAGFNIFARSQAPAESTAPEPAPTQYAPLEPTPLSATPIQSEPMAPTEPEAAPEPEPEPIKPATSGGFRALLKRVQAGAGMGAPGETDPGAQEAPIPPETPQMSAEDFVARTQATQVSDLLSGSAAWLTLVQNKTKFTRREVMEVFDTLPGEHPKTLEARIKGFGKLVRSGSLILIDDGVFAMAQNERDRFQQYLG